MKFKLIIAGGRDFDDFNLLKKTCDNMLLNINEYGYDIEIVSGGAKGADKLGERYAKDCGYKVKVFLADWSLGKKAGPIRNKNMAQYADALICFWDGESKGTRDMIKKATRLSLMVRVIKY